VGAVTTPKTSQIVIKMDFGGGFPLSPLGTPQNFFFWWFGLPQIVFFFFGGFGTTFFNLKATKLLFSVATMPSSRLAAEHTKSSGHSSHRATT